VTGSLDELKGWIARLRDLSTQYLGPWMKENIVDCYCNIFSSAAEDARGLFHEADLQEAMQAPRRPFIQPPENADTDMWRTLRSPDGDLTVCQTDAKLREASIHLLKRAVLHKVFLFDDVLTCDLTRVMWKNFLDAGVVSVTGPHTFPTHSMAEDAFVLLSHLLEALLQAYNASNKTEDDKRIFVSLLDHATFAFSRENGMDTIRFSVLPDFSNFLVWWFNRLAQIKEEVNLSLGVESIEILVEQLFCTLQRLRTRYETFMENAGVDLNPLQREENECSIVGNIGSVIRALITVNPSDTINVFLNRNWWRTEDRYDHWLEHFLYCAPRCN
jgi:hypothetical protein